MKKRAIIIIIALILTIIIFGIIDFQRFSNGKEPIFILKTDKYNDGGTIFYYGPGYQLIDWHILDYDEEQKKSFYHTKKELRILPFWMYGYYFERVNKSDFKIEYENPPSL